MLKHSLLTALSSLALLGISMPAQAKVVAVELNPLGAWVTDQVTLSDNNLKIAVPNDVRLEQVSISTIQGQPIIGTSLTRETIELEDAPDKRQQLEQALDTQSDLLAAEQQALADIQLQRDYLQRAQWSSEASTSLKQVLDDMRTALSQLLTQEQEHLGNSRAIEKKRDALLLQLKELGGKRKQQQSYLIGQGQTGGQYRIQYQTRSAQQSVSYNINLDSDTQQLHISPTLSVRQSSGIDWNNIQLSVNYSRPSFQLAPTPPHRQVIRFARPEPPHIYHSEAMPEAHAMDMAANKRHSLQAEKAMPASPIIQAQANDYDLKFSLTQAVTVASTNKNQTFPLPKITANATLVSRLVPQTSHEAYLIANWTVPNHTHLAPGKAQLSRDGVMIGQHHISYTPAGEKMETGFGSNPNLAIKIDKQPLKRSENFFGNKQKWAAKTHVAVTNNSKKSSVFEVLAYQPQSNDEAIEIRYTGNIQPTETAADNSKGLNRWQKTLAAGKELKWEIDYEITAPADETLIGL